jgi:pectinesterase
MRKTSVRLPAFFAQMLFVLVASTSGALAQDVHVRVIPGSLPTPADDVFPTIQMAMDHAPLPGSGGRLFLHIAPGAYHERVIVLPNRERTTFLGTGSDPSAVTITAAMNAKAAGGTFFTATVDVFATGFQADNITFENTAGNTGQAVALAIHADRAIVKRCRILGDQDTLFANVGRQYYVDTYIAGGVDFIFGNATAFFEHVQIHSIRPGYLTAQSRTSAEQTTGYVFDHATVTSSDTEGKSIYLGRPWRRFSRVVYLHSELPASLGPEGWSPWRKGEVPSDVFYAEYQNTGPGADVHGRVPWSRQLNAAEAAQYTAIRFLAGADHWNAPAEAAVLP